MASATCSPCSGVSTTATQVGPAPLMVQPCAPALAAVPSGLSSPLGLSQPDHACSEPVCAGPAAQGVVDAALAVRTCCALLWHAHLLHSGKLHRCQCKQARLLQQGPHHTASRQAKAPAPQPGSSTLARALQQAAQSQRCVQTAATVTLPALHAIMKDHDRAAAMSWEPWSKPCRPVQPTQKVACNEGAAPACSAASLTWAKPGISGPRTGSTRRSLLSASPSICALPAPKQASAPHGAGSELWHEAAGGASSPAADCATTCSNAPG